MTAGFLVSFIRVPGIFQTRIYSKKLVSVHLWLGTLGIVLYAVSMLLAAFSQSPKGAEFLLSVLNIQAGYIPHILVDFLRALGGGIYLAGIVIMSYNLVKTMLTGALKSKANPATATPFPQKSNFGLAFLSRIMETRHFLFQDLLRYFPATVPQVSSELLYRRGI